MIIIDGIPGSGKTTTASSILERLEAQQINTRCYLEQEESHPLLIAEPKFDSFENEEEADQFIHLLTSRFSHFVQHQLNSIHEVIIIESVLLQDAINVSHLMGMSHPKLLELCSRLQTILEPLNPILIYYYHMDVEGQWRFICSVRGNDWGPVSLHSDEDFKQAGEVWDKSQTFVRAVVDQWNIPKLIIENNDYHWDDYNQRINHFVDDCVRINKNN
nr:hypothetical protein [Paenibacillus castaneae]